MGQNICIDVRVFGFSRHGLNIRLSSLCLSKIWRSLSVPSKTLPVSLNRAESSSSRGNRDWLSHSRTLPRLKIRNGF